MKINQNYTVAKKGQYKENRRAECSVSNASKEIMLDRITNGDELEFPFLTQDKFN